MSRNLGASLARVTLGALLLGALSAPASASPASETTGRLEGVVTGQRYGLALPAVSVTLRAWRPQVRAGELPLVSVRQTDRNGTFAFDDLPAGLYALEATGEGQQRATVSPVLVVPGVPVTEHLVVAETPRPYRPPPPRT
jgi:hypothetical protein